MRRLLIVVLALGAILLFLLASAGANSSLFAHNYPVLLGLNIALAVALAVLVGLQLRKLWIEYRSRQFGSRLKLKLIGMFLLLAIAPGTLIYVISVQFAVRSIESWYNVRVDSALESGITLGRSALDALLDQLAERSRNVALELGDQLTPPSLPALIRLRERLDADEITLLTTSGRVVSSTGAAQGGLVPDVPATAQLRQARQSMGYRAVEGEGEKLVMRVVVPVPSRFLQVDPLLLQVRAAVPEALAHSADQIQELHRNYQELLLSRQGLKSIYLVTLTLALLLAMFAAMAVAFLFARSLSAPLLILAEGTQAVAAGDLSPRQALPARDELGVLTQSFNRMTRQLQDARALAEKSRSAVDAARAYLESVLANLSAGVLAFSSEGELRAANRGATAILQDDLIGFEAVPLAEWQTHVSFRDAVLAGFAEHEADWHRQLEITHGEGSVQTLLLHGSQLPESTGGFVVVFDDISELISAQRNAAWAEVARRLAHEIKNPLTPIQLSAERLQHKLADRLGDTDRAFLDRSTQTIVNQVEAMKNLVNGFRDYARLPAPQLAPLDLNALLREVLMLYEAAPVPIGPILASGLPLVQADASQLRQVIHNLLQNAQDAVAEHTAPLVELVTRLDGKRVELVVRDNGSGFPPNILSRAMEPYVTTKPRGSGLGLAIVRKIIEEHRGEIFIANRPEGGAEVKLRLRLAKLDATPPGETTTN
ncbi:MULTISPECIES: ATP-binding protein [unclassified Uliginosibacterium]|uniref:sensor histidine kinase n=1 Tax=unclassified Uliginosibacterium TaxID=2621521 RepID=UPI000C7AC936|nr:MULTISPECIES: ATP-binding protein [unclassified Uliginosibacterium]MDO6386110.1 ATP-binding protein [Uliginosibacterium sp. 31-12]PLK49176.1 PAS domain-containing sensor histidine kinase [Uliginosibacterium sp. TH139]